MPFDPSVLQKMPHVSAEKLITPKHLGLINRVLKQAGICICGTNTRDPSNSPVHELRAGLLMGKITATGKWANSIISVLETAYADDDLTLDVGIAGAVEIARRVGSPAGTVKVTGPATAGTAISTASVAYTAVNPATGILTVPDLNDDFILGSLVTPADGSETILGVFNGNDGYAVRNVDEDLVGVDLSWGQLIIGADWIDVAQIVHWPTDTSLIDYIKAALRANSSGWIFGDDY